MLRQLVRKYSILLSFIVCSVVFDLIYGTIYLRLAAYSNNGHLLYILSGIFVGIYFVEAAVGMIICQSNYSSKVAIVYFAFLLVIDSI